MGRLPKEKRKIVLKRDGYRCQKCGYDYLDIHFIDGNIENNNINNLEVLCRQCHIKYHQNEKLKNLKYTLKNFLNELFEDIEMVIITKENLKSHEDKVIENVLNKFAFAIARVLYKKLLEDINSEIEKERRLINKSLREIILKKYNYACSKCKYQYLEIHHIDGNHNNNNLDNLITLCRRCHREAHGNRSDKCIAGFYSNLQKVISEILKNDEKIIKPKITIMYDTKVSEKCIINYELKSNECYPTANEIIINWHMEVLRYLQKIE
jgi:5-methylcytosine-specific restriction endonuclease McrA